MSIILPNSVNYKEGLPTLPEGCQCINVATSPILIQEIKFILIF